MATKNLYLRSTADKNEAATPKNLRLRSDANKAPPQTGAKIPIKLLESGII